MRKGDDGSLDLPNLKRPFEAVDWQPDVARAREVGKDHPFKRANDEETNHRFGGSDRDSMRPAGWQSHRNALVRPTTLGG